MVDNARRWQLLDFHLAKGFTYRNSIG